MRHVRARPRRPASLYVRAALALGLVLGVGAAATDASWTDQELASATFTTAVFDTQSSATPADASSFASHNATAGALQFTAVTPTGATAGAIYPGVSLSTSFGIRAAAGSIAGAVTSIGPSANASSDAVLSTMTYTMYWINGTSCSGAPAGQTLAAAGTSLATAPTVSTPIPIPAGAGGAAGTAVTFCMTLTMPTSANPPQGTAAGAFTWTFNTQNS